MKHSAKLLISIVIPVYKDLVGLDETLMSIKGQTLSDECFEVIVVNDGSDQAIREYCLETNTQVVNLDSVGGSYRARNEGIRVSKGPYLAFIDADIVAQPDWLIKGLEYLREYDYVAGDIKIMQNHVVDIATYHDSLTAFPIKSYFDEFGFGVTGNLFVRKTVFEKIGVFNSLLRSGGDLEFGTRVAMDNSMRRVFAEDCVVLHLPRNHEEKIKKIRRVNKGHKDLIKLEYERFKFLTHNNRVIPLIKLLLPPTWNSVRSIYKPNKRFSCFALYLYVYRLKLCQLILKLSNSRRPQ